MKNFPKAGSKVVIEKTENITISRGAGLVESIPNFIEDLEGEEVLVLQSGVSGTLILCEVSGNQLGSIGIIILIELSDLKEIYQKGKIYVSGGISWNPKIARFRFNEACMVLREQGWDAINPFELDHRIAEEMENSGKHSHKEIHKEYMRVCIDALLKEDVGFVCLIDKWESSEGVATEIQLATKYNYKFFIYPEMSEITFS